MGWIADAITGMANSAYNVFTGERSRQDSLDVQRYQKEMANKQYQLQREQFEYQKSQAEYQKYFDANSVSIRAKDMENAGLSKTLAAGASGNSGMQFVSATGNPDSNLSVPSPSGRSPFDKMSSLIDFQMRAKQLELLNAQVDTQGVDKEIKRYNLNFARNNNLPYGDGVSGMERVATVLGNALAGNRAFSDFNKSLGDIADKWHSLVSNALDRLDKTADKVNNFDLSKIEDAIRSLPSSLRNESEKVFETLSQMFNDEDAVDGGYTVHDFSDAVKKYGLKKGVQTMLDRKSIKEHGQPYLQYYLGKKR